MDKEQREQAEYSQKLRRESRKLADKIFKAHKRQLVKQAENVSEARLPILKVDIIPLTPENNFINVADLKATSHTITARRQNLPQGLAISTVGGLIIQSELTVAGAFDQVYIGANGHLGLRAEKMFSGASDETFNPEGITTRAHSLIGAASELYSQYGYEGPIVVRVELADIRDWRLNGVGSGDDELIVAVLPQYVVELEVEKLILNGGFITNNTAINVGHDMLWQLGVSS